MSIHSIYVGQYAEVKYGPHAGSIARIVDTVGRYPDVDAIYVLQFDGRKKTVQIHKNNCSVSSYKGETKYVFKRAAPKKS